MKQLAFTFKFVDKLACIKLFFGLMIENFSEVLLNKFCWIRNTVIFDGKVKVDTYQNHFPDTVQIKSMHIIVGITSIYGTRKLI